MRKIFKELRLWAPTLIAILVFCGLVVRIHTTQAALIKIVNGKENAEVAKLFRDNVTRELNRLHESFERIESKIDDLLSHTIKNPDPNGRD